MRKLRRGRRWQRAQRVAVEVDHPFGDDETLAKVSERVLRVALQNGLQVHSADCRSKQADMDGLYNRACA